MPETKNPQDIPTTFLRKLPDGKIEKLDANGQPVKAAAQAQAPTEDKRTVAQLTEALEAKKVAIPDGSKRDDLVKLAADNGI